MCHEDGQIPASEQRPSMGKMGPAKNNNGSLGEQLFEKEFLNLHLICCIPMKALRRGAAFSAHCQA